MTPFRFYITIFFSVIFMMLSLIESFLYHSMETELDIQRDHQSKADYVERVDIETDRVLRRAATEAMSDPALMEILRTQGIKIQASSWPQPPEPAPASVPPPTTNDAPSTPGNP